MKVLHVSPDENGGGAAKAAYRIHYALKTTRIDSRMLVLNKHTNDSSITSINSTLLQKLRNKAYKFFNRRLNKKNIQFQSQNEALHSFGWTGYNLSEYLNQSDADIIHLHWIVGMLSIQDIGKITKPIVWTLHDMWPFCGGEHYVRDDSATSRFKAGYLQNNQPAHEIGPDLNRLSWEAKTLAWKNQAFSIVGTSNWIKQCAQDSLLFKNKAKFYKIPLPINMEEIWKSQPKLKSREHFKLPQYKKLILAGASGGINNFYKGGDLLKEVLHNLSDKVKVDCELVLFGEEASQQFHDWSLPLHNIGKITDQNLLAKLYSCADVVIMPSRQEAFGQIASEAQACGVPVAAFAIGGPLDIVEHQKTGWLAPAFDAKDLAKGVEWILMNQSSQELSQASRVRAVKLFSEESIGQQYLDVYQQTLLSQT